MNNRSVGLVAAVVLLLLIGGTACRRKRDSSSRPAVVERTTAEGAEVPAATPAPEASSPATATSSADTAAHPGETQNPAAIKLAMDQFERRFQRPPNDWQEMIDAKVLAGAPKRKDGQPLEFSEFVEFYFHRNAGRR